MILNKLVFPIKIGATFVEGAIPTGKLTGNNINKDMIYVISPVVGATAITATFQNSLQGERAEYMNMSPSSLKVSDLVRESESYYDLIKDWNVWQGFMPNKVLGNVAYNRAGTIGVSFNFRQAIVPYMVGQTYRGEIIKDDFVPTENGYYIVKTPLFIYGGKEFTFNDVLIKLNDEILIKKAIFTVENTSTLNYSVDPSVFESEFEGFDISLTESVVHNTNENTTDIKILFNNQSGIYYDIAGVKDRLYVTETDITNLHNKNTEQDNRLDVIESDIEDIEDVDRNQNDTLQDHDTRITKNTQDIAEFKEGLIKIDDITITKNDDEELEVSTMVLDDIESRVSKNEFENWKITNTNKINAVDNGLQIQIDEMEFVVDITLAGNDIKVEHRDGDVTYIPVNEAVESGYYDTNTKELVLELANGNEIRIPAGDIVAGLASVDYVDTGLALKENKSNKITELVGVPNNTQYMSAKLTNDLIMAARTEINSLLDDKVDKVSGKGLSTNDYTTAEKNKLTGIEEGAQVNAVTTVAGRTGAVVLAKADVGLGSVQNYAIASKTQAESGTENNLYMTPLRTKELITNVIGDIESALDAILGE